MVDTSMFACRRLSQFVGLLGRRGVATHNGPAMEFYFNSMMISGVTRLSLATVLARTKPVTVFLIAPRPSSRVRTPSVGNFDKNNTAGSRV